MIEALPRKTVAVVGNGPTLTGRGLGAEINAHEFVVRFNNFRTAGFEADAGSKTTTWATTFAANVAQRREAGLQVRGVLPLMHSRFWQRHARHYPIGFDCACAVECSQTMDFLEIPFDIFERAGRVSAGMLYLFWLYVERGWSLDGISLYGFAHFDPCAAHHYWNPAVGASASERAHSTSVEAEFLRKMLAKEIR